MREGPAFNVLGGVGIQAPKTVGVARKKNKSWGKIFFQRNSSPCFPLKANIYCFQRRGVCGIMLVVWLPWSKFMKSYFEKLKCVLQWFSKTSYGNCWDKKLLNITLGISFLPCFDWQQGPSKSKIFLHLFGYKINITHFVSKIELDLLS